MIEVTQKPSDDTSLVGSHRISDVQHWGVHVYESPPYITTRQVGGFHGD